MYGQQRYRTLCGTKPVSVFSEPLKEKVPLTPQEWSRMMTFTKLRRTRATVLYMNVQMKDFYNKKILPG